MESIVDLALAGSKAACSAPPSFIDWATPFMVAWRSSTGFPAETAAVARPAARPAPARAAQRTVRAVFIQISGMGQQLNRSFELYRRRGGFSSFWGPQPFRLNR